MLLSMFSVGSIRLDAVWVFGVLLMSAIGWTGIGYCKIVKMAANPPNLRTVVPLCRKKGTSG
jgi:hypothetical protein